MSRIVSMRARLLDRREITSLQTGDEILVQREFGGKPLYYPATVYDVKITDVTRGAGSAKTVVGQAVQIRYTDMFGASSALPTVHTTPEAFDAKYPPGTAEDKYRERKDAARAEAVEHARRVKVAVPDPDGRDDVRVVPVYGANANISLSIPGVDADDLERLLREVLTEHVPNGRLLRLKTRPLADLRVNVMSSIQPGASLLGSNILAGEVHTLFPGNLVLAEIDPDSDPIVG